MRRLSLVIERARTVICGLHVRQPLRAAARARSGHVLDAADSPSPIEDAPARAAALVVAAAVFASRIRSGTLPLETGVGGAPLCMDGYKRLFASTRLPGIEIDEVRTFRAYTGARAGARMCAGISRLAS